MFLYDRVKQYTYVNGTGAATVSGDLGAFKKFSDVLSDGSRLYYTIENTGSFEVGLGTYSGNAIYRDTVYSSSNSNQHVNFDGTRSSIFLTVPATGIIYRQENGYVGINTTGVPEVALHVNGEIRSESSISSRRSGCNYARNHFSLYRPLTTSDNNSGIYYRIGGLNTGAGSCGAGGISKCVYIFNQLSSSGTLDNDFYGKNGQNLCVYPGGRVGINFATESDANLPRAMLHIRSTGVGSANSFLITDSGNIDRFSISDSGSVFASGSLSINSTTIPGILITNPSGNAQIRLTNGNNNWWNVNNLTSDDLRFQYNGSTALYINNNRQIDIGGGTNPGSQLRVVPTGSTSIGMIIKGAASQSANLTEWRNSSDSILSFISNNGSGYFGSGVYSSGDIQSQYIRLTYNGNGSVIRPNGGIGNLSFLDAFGTPWITMAVGGKVHIGGSHFDGFVQVNTNGHVSVGAGTATPAHRLHVAGSGYFQSGLATSGNLLINPISGIPIVAQLGSGNTSNLIDLKDNGGTSRFYITNNGRIYGNELYFTAGVGGLRNPAGYTSLIDYDGTNHLSILRGQINAMGNFYVGAPSYVSSSMGARLDILNDSSSKIGVIVKGAAAQSANLTEWRNSSDTVLASISNSGAAYFASTGNFGGTLTVSSNGVTSSNWTRINGTNYTDRGIAIRDGAFALGSNVIIGWSTSLDPIANQSLVSLTPSSSGLTLDKSLFVNVSGRFSSGLIVTPTNGSQSIVFNIVDSSNFTRGYIATTGAASAALVLRDYTNSNYQSVLGPSSFSMRGAGNVTSLITNDSTSSNCYYAVGRSGQAEMTFGLNPSNAFEVSVLRNDAGLTVQQNSAGLLTLGSAHSSAKTILRAAGKTMVQASGDGQLYFNVPTNVNNDTSSSVALTIKGAAAQSANLFEINNSSLQKLAYFDSSGNLTLNSNIGTISTGTVLSSINFNALNTPGSIKNVACIKAEAGRDGNDHDYDIVFYTTTNTGSGNGPRESFRLTYDRTAQITIDGNATQSLNNGLIITSQTATSNPEYCGLTVISNITSAPVSGYFRAARTSGNTYRGVEVVSLNYDGIRFLTNGTSDTNERARLNNNGLSVYSSGYFQSGILSSGSITTSNTLTIGVYTDAQRPVSGNVGTMIFNSTDGNLNIWNGSNWILPDGSVT